MAIGRSVRAFRRQQGLTVTDLAGVTGLSIGMLSKIVNGITSLSLTTLQILSHAFSTPVTSSFRGFEERREMQHVKAGEHFEIARRGTRAGHQHHLPGHIGSNSSGVVVEPYLVTLTEESATFPTFQHGRIELLYMMESEVEYCHGDQLFHLKPGDSLIFDTDAQHSPGVHVKLPAVSVSQLSGGVGRREHAILTRQMTHCAHSRRRTLLGGILKHASALAAICNPTVNSYKRANAPRTTSGAAWVPNTVTWTGNNRAHMVRVPGPGRLELRPPDGAANPYLLQAVSIAATLDGIRSAADPGPRSDIDMQTIGHTITDAPKLPPNLLDALRDDDKDDTLKSLMGHVFSNFHLKLKRQEWDSYTAHFSRWEHDNTIDI